MKFQKKKNDSLSGKKVKQISKHTSWSDNEVKKVLVTIGAILRENLLLGSGG